MEGLWLQPTCATDGNEWGIIWSQLQSIKGTMPVQKYYHCTCIITLS